MKTKWMAKQVSVPVALAVSLGSAVILALSTCAVITTMVLNGKIQEAATGIILRVILVLSVFAGLKINLSLRKEDRYMLGGIYAAAVVLLTLISGIAMGIDLKDCLINLVFILCGVAVGLLIGYKKPKKRPYSKRRYC